MFSFQAVRRAETCRTSRVRRPEAATKCPDYWAVTERRVDAVPTPPALVAATLTKYVAPVVRDGMVQVRPALVAEQEDTAVPPVDAV